MKKNIPNLSRLLSLLLLGACMASQGIPLRPLPTLQDRGDLAELGQAPLMLHPDGVEISVAGSLVQDDEGNPKFQFTFLIENRSGQALEFPWNTFWSRTDHGPRKSARQALYWNPKTEEYERAPRVVRPGEQVLIVLRTGIEETFNPFHLVRLTLHWKYQTQGRILKVASRFRPE